jgi:hypothetical protein
MAWTSPITFYDGDPLTAAQLNTSLTDNLNATATGVASYARQLVVSSGKNQITTRQWVKANKINAVSISAAFPADPDNEDDFGPEVTFEHGGGFILLYDCTFRRLSGTGYVNYAPVITAGPGELPAYYNIGVRTVRTDNLRTGGSVIVQGYDAGTTTVTMKYGGSPGTGAAADCRYADRRLTAIPL